VGGKGKKAKKVVTKKENVFSKLDDKKKSEV
jgi:hypothetical protein